MPFFFFFDKVTTETYNFVSVILNSNPVGATITGATLLFPATLTVISAKTQFLDQVKINSTSQLINGIFDDLQKLLKCFSGITTSVSFLPTSSPPIILLVFPCILVLYLKVSQLGEKVALHLSL